MGARSRGLVGVDVQRVPLSPRAAAGEVALVVARPIALAIVTHVLALVVLGAPLIVSIVVSIVAMSGAPLTSS